MSRERNAFLKAIEADPLDEVRRLVFADWLQENGEEDEADRQRAWVAAYKYLAPLADPYDEGIEYAGVMAAVKFWADGVRGDGGVYFGDDEPPIRFEEDAKEKERFLRSLEVVSGTAITKRQRANVTFACAC
jgi:uncharacterized protein (TIGR02996 family)